MSELSDEVIMRHVKDGNLAEMSVLFERYHVKLYNYLLKLTFDRTVSQDLTQNLFYRVLKYRHTYDEQHSFKSWIYQMARNIHIDYCKEKTKSNTSDVRRDENAENIPEIPPVYSEEQYSLLEKALQLLSPDQLELIVMSRFQGMKYEEISAITRSSVPAIKVQMYRAIRQLRTHFFNLS